MSGTLVGLVAVILGIDAGWQPTPNGGLEYIIQIEPEMLDRLRAGQEIQSDIPPELRSVESYRIIVGKNKLPRKGLPSKSATAPKPTAEENPAPVKKPPPEQETKAVPKPTADQTRMPGQEPARLVPENLAAPSLSSAFPPLVDPPNQNTPSPSDAFGNQDREREDGVPRELPLQAEGRMLEADTALFEQGVGQQADSTPDGMSPANEAPKPWLLFWAVAGTAVGLFAAFLYLLWIHWETRSRYRALLAQCEPESLFQQAASP